MYRDEGASVVRDVGVWMGWGVPVMGGVTWRSHTGESWVSHELSHGLGTSRARVRLACAEVKTGERFSAAFVGDRNAPISTSQSMGGNKVS